MPSWPWFKIISAFLMVVSAFVTTMHVDDVVIRLPFVYNLEYNLFSVNVEIIGTQFVNRLYMRLRCLVAFSFPNKQACQSAFHTIF